MRRYYICDNIKIKTMNFKLFAFTLILILCGLSCLDECSEVVCENGGVCVSGVCDCPDGFEGEFCEIHSALLLKREFSEDETLTTYDYNDDRLLTTLTRYFQGEISQTIDYQYFPDSIVINYTYPPDTDPSILVTSYSKYSKISGDEIRYESYLSNGELLTDRTFKSFDENCSYSIIDEDEIRTKYTFTDENCSSIYEVGLIQEEEPAVRVTSVKDDKNFAYQSTIIPYFSAPNRGNEIEFLSESLSAGTTIQRTFVYEFNTQDYPIKRSSYDGSELKSEIEFEYY